MLATFGLQLLQRRPWQFLPEGCENAIIQATIGPRSMVDAISLTAPNFDYLAKRRRLERTLRR